MDPGDEEANNMRQRKVGSDHVDHSNAGLYKELERLRNLVDVIEGDQKGGNRSSSSSTGGLATCLPITLDNSVMSTVFGLVFLTIISVTIYAFHNLFRAISRRFFEAEPDPL